MQVLDFKKYDPIIQFLNNIKKRCQSIAAYDCSRLNCLMINYDLNFHSSIADFVFSSSKQNIY